MDTSHTVRDLTVSGGGSASRPVELWRPGPTVPRMALGARLRVLREESGLTHTEAGAAIGVSRSKISRLEHGRTGSKQRDVEALLALYGVVGEAERSVVRTLAEQANTPGWWHRYLDLLPSWLHDYLGAEQAADVIRGYEVQFVPGLLQTPAYAREVVRLGHPDAPKDVLDRHVEFRMRRQEVLDRPTPPHLWVVVDEAVLRRPLGSRAVMRDQLDHLARMARRPHITVQLLPFACGGHPALCGSVTMLRLPGGQLPDMVYLEQLTSAVYPDKPADVHHYWDVLNRLVVQAERASRTPELLRALRDDL
ncbi:helix-turn-helix transcriptional regulator [Streptomyces sp. DSM 42041]|uniref:Helix-turn-helix transcriptional regulator n=1 Tax=Streptomyces hazeniae TaxID=3075538 RepID=A0ABU2NTR8_9ACTN|nr:helix-turn-helix transcriptional regulator [Streptomyces sp. DSM 42041]MDT0379367.1 helix-turn-helix transcriptional regulator [Streptomyces sp. DSM 42041]